MHWELWIVPVIALFVWIISQFRGSEEPPKSAPAPEGDSARPGGEVEKFLQELDRMRRKNAAERTAEVRPAPPALESIPEVIPVAQPVSVAQEEPVRPQKPKTRTRPRPTQAARPAPPRGVLASSPAVIPGAPPVAIKPGPVAQARALLRTPEAVQTAFVLHEILGPPRCYKRERG